MNEPHPGSTLRARMTRIVFPCIIIPTYPVNPSLYECRNASKQTYQLFDMADLHKPFVFPASLSTLLMHRSRD